MPAVVASKNHLPPFGVQRKPNTSKRAKHASFICRFYYILGCIFFTYLEHVENMLNFFDFFCSKPRTYDAQKYLSLFFSARITISTIFFRFFLVQNTFILSRQKSVMLILKSRSKSVTI